MREFQPLKLIFFFLDWEIGLGSEMFEESELSVRELTLNSIDTLVDIELCFLENGRLVLEMIILVSVGMDGHVENVHLYDKV